MPSPCACVRARVFVSERVRVHTCTQRHTYRRAQTHTHTHTIHYLALLITAISLLLRYSIAVTPWTAFAFLLGTTTVPQTLLLIPVLAAAPIATLALDVRALSVPVLDTFRPLRFPLIVLFLLPPVLGLVVTIHPILAILPTLLVLIHPVHIHHS